ncbi:MAG: pyridoxal phosphate-dependent aminotransferase [Lachnospiraceae bacterium]
MYNFDKVRKRIGTYSFKWDQYQDEEILALSTADMDFDSPKEIQEALIERAKEGIYAYEDKSEGYYQAIEGWYERRFNWKIEREWLSNTPGVWTAMHLCVEAFTEPGDAILVHSPHFSPIPNIIKGCHRRMVTNTMPYDEAAGKYVIDFISMERVIVEEQVKAFIMINPQNPTGRVFTKEELTKIGELCARYNVPVISDEVHGHVVYDGCRHLPACMVSEELKRLTAIITAPSKSFNLQGMTYAVVIIPDEGLREKFEAERSGYNMEFAVNVFSLAAVEAAYSKCDGWLNALNEYLLGNLNFLTEYIEKNIPDIKVIRPEGSYMVWLDFRKFGKTPEELRQLLLGAHIGFTYGDSFGPEGEGYERINIGCPRSTLEKCLERLKGMVDSIA